MERVSNYLKHMMEHIRDIKAFIKDTESFEAFEADRKTHQAVTYGILNIGELANDLKKLFPDVLDRHPEIPWNGIIGTRNRAAHGYHKLNLEYIWDAAKNDLPVLEKVIQKELDRC